MSTYTDSQLRISQLLTQLDEKSRVREHGFVMISEMRDLIWRSLSLADSQEYPRKFRNFKARMDKTPYVITYKIMTFIRQQVQQWVNRNAPISSVDRHSYIPSVSSPALDPTFSSASASNSLFENLSNVPSSFNNQSSATHCNVINSASGSSSTPIIQPAPPIQFPLLTPSQFLDFIPSTWQDSAPQPSKSELPQPPQMTSTDYIYDESENKLERHKCPICIHVAFNPVSVGCCGQVYCKSCFNQMVGEMYPMITCSTCKAQITRSIRTPNGFNDYFNDLRVKCPTCELIHPRGQFNKHWLHECKTLCLNQCGQLLSRTEIVSHATVCSHVQVKCSWIGCNHCHPRKDHSDHTEHCKYRLLNKLTVSQIMELAIQQVSAQEQSHV
jgi:hypothetical protein